jgi:hypothetical protein
MAGGLRRREVWGPEDRWQRRLGRRRRRGSVVAPPTGQDRTGGGPVTGGGGGDAGEARRVRKGELEGGVGGGRVGGAVAGSRRTGPVTEAVGVVACTKKKEAPGGTNKKKIGVLVVG